MMLVEQVCESEYSALEQALAAAEQRGVKGRAGADRSLADHPVPLGSSDNKSWLPRLEASAPATTTSIGAGTKRKLPTSFTHADATPGIEPVASLHYQGQITYAYTSLEVDYHCTQLFNKGPQALGFDIEWLVTYKAGQVPRKTALLQLCHRQGKGSYQCYLLHLTHSGVTPALSRLLQSEVVKKLGIGIHGDAQKLHRDFGLQCAGLVCLSEVANARLCSSSNGRLPQKWSLAGLTHELLHLGLDKSSEVRCSNWEQRPLTPGQQAYAATDAYAALKLHQVLQSMPIVEVAHKPAQEVVSAEEDEGVRVLHVPARAELLQLQPSKLAVYKLFAEQGMSLEGITSQRGVQLSTVQSYIAEAMAAGYAYPWHRLGVPHHVMAVVCDHLQAFHKQQQQQEPWPGDDQKSGHERQQEVQHHPEREGQHQAKAHGSSVRPDLQPAAAAAQQQGRGAVSGMCQAPVLHASARQHLQHLHDQQHKTANVQWSDGRQQQPHRGDLQPSLQQNTTLPLQKVTHSQLLPHQQQQEPFRGSDQHGSSDLPGLHTSNGMLKDQGLGCRLTLPVWLHPNGTVTAESQDLQAHAAQSESVSSQLLALPDVALIRELVKTGQGTKALRDQMGSDAISYGHLRLALAHVYRLQLAVTDCMVLS